MSDEALQRLASRAGIAVHWHDYRGQPHTVGAQTLRQLLSALDLPANGDAAIAASNARLDGEGAAAPLLTADAGALVTLSTWIPQRTAVLVLHHEHGGSSEVAVERHGDRACVRAPAQPGYYTFDEPAADRSGSGAQRTLAVAPAHCTLVPRTRAARPWGIAAQLYSLAEPGDMGLASYATLARFATRAAAHGADAVAVSPTHAMFSADPGRCSPYGPSSRLFLNALHIDPVQAFGAARVERALDAPGLRSAARHLESHALVDWSTAGSLRLALLRDLLHDFDRHDPAGAAEFAAFRGARGEALETHARFETLHALLGGGGWHDWPAEFHDPDGAPAQRLAAQHPRELHFHALLQWLAHRQLAQAQREARAAGMSIGLVADLAIGADPGGSHAWTRQRDMLRGLSVGAPPDLLAPAGQAWGLAAFSPVALARSGFRAFIELLRATMANAGGLRIDHVMGLQRLWVVPEGGESRDGAYLAYPVHDLLRLVALESWRHRCIVVGEDLGTVDPALREELGTRGLLGMSVLYFEQRDEHFVAPRHWRRASVAMSSTHDLPTLAGWWEGRDIELRAALAPPDPAAQAQAHAQRERERGQLWHAIGEAGGPRGALPDRNGFVDAAIAHVGRAACELALIPLEDVLGTADAPNLPGTIDEHPNWRRRLPSPTAAELEHPEPAARLAALAAARADGA